jgi:hypothetical protein
MTKKIYKLQINYNSGLSKEFWVNNYEILENGAINWEERCSQYKPIWNNPANVESIWVVEELEEQEIEDAVV